jgi:hypothetical protein
MVYRMRGCDVILDVDLFCLLVYHDMTFRAAAISIWNSKVGDRDGNVHEYLAVFSLRVVMPERRNACALYAHAVQRTSTA